MRIFLCAVVYMRNCEVASEPVSGGAFDERSRESSEREEETAGRSVGDAP